MATLEQLTGFGEQSDPKIGFPWQRVDAAKRYLYLVKPWWSRYSEHMLVVPVSVPSPDPETQEFGFAMATDTSHRLFVDRTFAANAPLEVIAALIEHCLLHTTRDHFRRLTTVSDEDWAAYANIAFDLEINSAIDREAQALTFDRIVEKAMVSSFFTTADLELYGVQQPPYLPDDAWLPRVLGLPDGLSAEKYFELLKSNERVDEQEETEEKEVEEQEQQESELEDTDEQQDSSESGLHESATNESESENSEEPTASESDAENSDSKESEQTESSDSADETSSDAAQSDAESDSETFESESDADSSSDDATQSEHASSAADDESSESDSQQTSSDDANSSENDASDADSSASADADADSNESSDDNDSSETSSSQSAAAQQESLREQVARMKQQGLAAAMSQELSNPNDELTQQYWKPDDTQNGPGADEIAQAERALAEDIERAAQSGELEVSGFGEGDDEAHLIEWSAEFKERHFLKWEQRFERLFAAAVSSVKVNGMADMGYSKRASYQPSLGPVYMGMYDYAPTVYGILDISPSMVWGRHGGVSRLEMAMSVIDESARSFAKKFGMKITWIGADTRILAVEPADKWNAMLRQKFAQTTGGTTLGDVIEQVMQYGFTFEKKRYQRPDLLLVVTDCDFLWPKSRPRTSSKILVVNVHEKGFARRASDSGDFPRHGSAFFLPLDTDADGNPLTTSKLAGNWLKRRTEYVGIHDSVW